MEYGYIKDTTMKALADNIRNKGMVPATRKATIYNDTYDICSATTSRVDPTPGSFIYPTPDSTSHPWTYFSVTVPEATTLKLKVLINSIKYDGYSVSGPAGHIYVKDSSGNSIAETSSYTGYTVGGGTYETEQTWVVNDNYAYISIKHETVSYGRWGAIIKVIPVDAEGNEIKALFPEEIDVFNTITPEEMVEALENCPPPPPEKAYTIKGDCKYAFYNGRWDWFIENYGDRITTEAITNGESMFDYSKLKEIPFTINVNNPSSMNYMFGNMSYLTKCPKIRGSLSASTSWPSARVCITSAYRLRDAEDLITPEMLSHVKDVKVTSSYGGGYQFKFTYCYSLRKVPSWWKLQKLHPESTVIPNSSIAGLYPDCFRACYVLDEIVDIPVWACKGTMTSNMFGSTFYQIHRVKDIIFETDNGNPIVAQWKSQTIDLGTNSGVGYVFSTGNGSILNYNSGITEATHVKSDETYQALKNDPDYWTDNVSYSRYNHDSAVRTINSLPDTYDYLASTGGTNTIKFKGNSGSKTDGGAIDTLTAEEIAVATAKGWTVSLV